MTDTNDDRLTSPREHSNRHECYAEQNKGSAGSKAADRPWFIYVLKDPRDNAIRYVGWTFDAKRRSYTHIRDARTERTRKANWINGLLGEGARPLLEVVESGSGDGWADAERHWIAHYRSSGANLTNLTDGGDGTPNYRHTDRAKALMAAAWNGRVLSPEIIAQRNAAIRCSEKARAALRAVHEAHRGKPLSAEHRLRISEGQRGKIISAESRNKISLARTGQKLSPGHAARSRELLRMAREKQIGVPTSRRAVELGVETKTLRRLFRMAVFLIGDSAVFA